MIVVNQLRNMKKTEQIVIVGGGLSGLSLAWWLSKEGITPTILEASSRLGGRILTKRGKLGTPLELGATWFSDLHTNLLALIDDLELRKFHQFSEGISLFQTKSFEPPQKFFVPGAESPSYRLAGGTQELTDTLAKQLPAGSIRLNSRVVAVKEKENGLLVVTADGRTLNPDLVVLCLPPQLAASRIVFAPELPMEVRKLLPAVQTWMAGAIKFTVEYAEPFWRNQGYSGMLYSHAGIIAEMYDHTNMEEDKFGFTGFLNGGAASYTPAVRKEFAIRQLAELLGDKAAAPVSYFDKVWTGENVLAGNQIIQRPHQNNGHPLLQTAYMNGKLFFCGTETATAHAGYMEGAVISAKKIAHSLLRGIAERKRILKKV